MAKIYYQNDCNLGLLDGKKVAIIGYGSQGHAHALNLHESGVDVIVGLYEGSNSKAKAEAKGLTVMNVAEAVKAAKEGTELIYNKMMNYLKGKGLSVIEAKDKEL